MSSLIRHAIVENGVISNIIEYETLQTGCPDGFENVLAIATDTGQIGWAYVDGLFIDPTPKPTETELLDNARAAKISEIVTDCQAEMDSGFTSSFGIKMDSNLAALQKIKLGYDFATIMGAAEMEIVDYNNVAHIMPIADVLTQMLETGGHYLSLYTKKQVLRAQAMAAELVDLDVIVW